MGPGGLTLDRRCLPLPPTVGQDHATGFLRGLGEGVLPMEESPPLYVWRTPIPWNPQVTSLSTALDRGIHKGRPFSPPNKNIKAILVETLASAR